MAAPAQPVNYQALLNSDPVLQASLGQINTAAAANQGALTAARQTAIIQGGFDPTAFANSGVGNVAADITPAVQQEAQQATQAGLSQLGQAQHGYNLAQSQSLGSLAARGMLHSGAFRQHNLANLAGLQTDIANREGTTLGQLANAWNAYTGQQANLAGQAQTATENAATRLTNLIGQGVYGSPPATTGTTSQGTGTVPRPAPNPRRFQTARNTTGGPGLRAPVPTATVKPLA